MSGTLNKVILIGHLGKDPEIRQNGEGKKFANFSIATTEKWTDKTTGEKKNRTEWHKVVVANDGLVGVIKSYASKGSLVYIEGSLRTRKWQDKLGKDNYTTEIRVESYKHQIQLLGGKKDEEQEEYDF